MNIVTVTTKGCIRPRRFRGICAAARELDVTREHLYLVLMGERHSPRIMSAITIVDVRGSAHTGKSALHGANSTASKSKNTTRKEKPLS